MKIIEIFNAFQTLQSLGMDLNTVVSFVSYRENIPRSNTKEQIEKENPKHADPNFLQGNTHHQIRFLSQSGNKNDKQVAYHSPKEQGC